jgi:Asp-tRNA(Asn)/Glu-tRNA(Gln) amidotransferase A subunit family amidase
MQQQQWELRLRDLSSLFKFKFYRGLKPTTSLLSRSGIVPLSSTLDTPGPMTKKRYRQRHIISVMTGEDSADPVTENSPKDNKNIGKSYKLQV